MSTKKYHSKSVLSFNVNGQRISFSPQTNGTCHYVTDDENMQNSLERHPWFKDKFFEDKEYSKKIKALEDENNSEDTPKSKSANSKKKEAKKEKIEKEFSNTDDAKEYVANTFGIARTSLKSTDEIIKQGEKNGVTIIIKE